MKHKITTMLVACITLLAMPIAFADGDHSEGKVPGPHGGRVIDEIHPHLEFYLRADRTIQIAALTDDFKEAPLIDLELSGISGSRTAPITVEFIREGNFYISKKSLPDGDNLPLILSIKTPDSDTVHRERINLDLSICSGCQLNEYACICGH